MTEPYTDGHGRYPDFNQNVPKDDGEIRVPFHVLAILMERAGWSWDYWGKFYGPADYGHPKLRELDWVFTWIANQWSCPTCQCVGCDCCSVGYCHRDNWMYPDPKPCVNVNEVTA
jgi:hypothetical protein